MSVTDANQTEVVIFKTGDTNNLSISQSIASYPTTAKLEDWALFLRTFK